MDNSPTQRASELWSSLLTRHLSLCIHSHLLHLFSDAQDIIKSTGHKSKEKIFGKFQLYCSRIKNWSDQELNGQIEALRSRYKDLDNLVSSVLLTNLMTMSIVRAAGITKIPPPVYTVSGFIKQCYVKCALEVACPYPVYFDKDVDPISRIKYHRKAQQLIEQKIEDAVIDTINPTLEKLNEKEKRKQKKKTKRRKSKPIDMSHSRSPSPDRSRESPEDTRYNDKHDRHNDRQQQQREDLPLRSKSANRRMDIVSPSASADTFGSPEPVIDESSENLRQLTEANLHRFQQSQKSPEVVDDIHPDDSASKVFFRNRNRGRDSRMQRFMNDKGIEDPSNNSFNNNTPLEVKHNVSPQSKTSKVSSIPPPRESPAMLPSSIRRIPEQILQPQTPITERVPTPVAPINSVLTTTRIKTATPLPRTPVSVKQSTPKNVVPTTPANIPRTPITKPATPIVPKSITSDKVIQPSSKQASIQRVQTPIQPIKVKSIERQTKVEPIKRNEPTPKVQLNQPKTITMPGVNKPKVSPPKMKIEQKEEDSFDDFDDTDSIDEGNEDDDIDLSDTDSIDKLLAEEFEDDSEEDDSSDKEPNSEN